MKDHSKFRPLFPVMPFAAAAAARSNEWREHIRSQSLAQNPRVTVAPLPQVGAVIVRSREWRAKVNPSLAG